MSKIGITDLSLGQNATSELKSAAAKVEVAKEAGASCLAPLTQVTPDLGSHFINELTSSLTDIYAFLNDILYGTAEAYFRPEDDADGGSGNGNYGKGNSSGSGEEAIPAAPVDPVIEVPDTTPIDKIPDTIPDTEPEPESGIQEIILEEIDTTELEQLSLDDLYGVIDELVELVNVSKKTLDEILDTDEYSDKIKETLLNSPYLSKEFKDVILDLDSSAVRVLLKCILKGKLPEIFDLNTLNVGIVYSILESTANEYGVLINELLTNSKYTSILKDKLASFGSVVEIIKGWEELSDEDFQVQLKAFYLGDVSEEFPTSDILTTRAYVDYLADACDVSYEDLINDSSYASTLKEGAVQFGKALTFFNAQSFFSDEAARQTVNGVFNGTNYKVYGMTEESIEDFRKEMDSLASANDTTTEKLLSDSKYADMVKDALQSSDSATGVGMIYRNSSSSMSQTVAKNLYNTNFDDMSEEQKELDEILKNKATKITTEIKNIEANASSGEVK